MLVANITGCGLGLLIGYVSDKVKVWPILLAEILGLIGSLTLFVKATVPGEGIYTSEDPHPTSMTVSFILVNILSGLFMGMISILTCKAIENATNSRGIIVGAVNMAGYSGTILIDSLGGELYDTDQRNPFFMCLIASCFVAALVIVLAACGELRI